MYFLECQIKKEKTYRTKSIHTRPIGIRNKFTERTVTNTTT